MKSTVVYESRWGNTSRTAGAIAEDIGPQVRAVSTAEATAARIAGADLIVAGGHSRSAALDARVRGPFESAAPAIAEALQKAGYASVAKPTGFIVAGKFGPLRDGEVERARQWGSELGKALA